MHGKANPRRSHTEVVMQVVRPTDLKAQWQYLNVLPFKHALLCDQCATHTPRDTHTVSRGGPPAASQPPMLQAESRMQERARQKRSLPLRSLSHQRALAPARPQLGTQHMHHLRVLGCMRWAARQQRLRVLRRGGGGTKVAHVQQSCTCA